jgi:predicted DNA-binding transcriptional regulator AlpA
MKLMNTDTLLTVEDAAAHLKISKHTLNRWRVTGEGPPFIKYGPRLVRYLVTTLDVWAQERMFANTSQYER